MLAMYFVFYALNGFLQHSNCNVRLGWLNQIVGWTRAASLASFGGGG